MPCPTGSAHMACIHLGLASFFAGPVVLPSLQPPVHCLDTLQFQELTMFLLTVQPRYKISLLNVLLAPILPYSPESLAPYTVLSL